MGFNAYLARLCRNKRRNKSTVLQTTRNIGGLEKVSEIKQYKNLNALIESVPEWLTDNKYEAGPLRSPAGLKLYDQVSKHVNHNVLDNLENNVDYWNETVGSNKMYFQPDGRHANKFAHRKIYQVLKKEFKN